MSIIWQADLSRRPFTNQSGSPLWALLICCDTGAWQFSAQAPQAEIDSKWVNMQLAIALADYPDEDSSYLPQKIQVFRPQSFSLIAAGAEPFGIAVEPTRDTPALKRLLMGLKSTALQADWNPVQVEEMPPLPLPERLQGERWRFAALPASELEAEFQNRPIPVMEMPELRSPLRLGLSSTLPIPGLIIDGGRASMQLARWLLSVRPYALNYISGAPDGVILQAGLAERWVMATFEDTEMAQAARTFQQRKHEALGLHFLLVQPDDSGMTYSGIWLLQAG
jgi:hypothetical protein